MTTYRDKSGNGVGVELEPHMNLLDLSTVDATIPGKTRRLRAGTTGNLIIRPAGGSADITIAMTAGQDIPVTPGGVVRRTGTTAAPITATGF